MLRTGRAVGMSEQRIASAAPRHVAFIMDGNGRWATRQGLPRLAGHRQGIDNVERIAGALLQRGVSFMTIYMFSTENWKRPKEEVDGIFALLTGWLEETGPRMPAAGIRFRHFGRREPLPAALLAALDGACADSAPASRLLLGLCINYGGRAEIVDAIRHALSRHPAGSIDERSIAEGLYTAGVPDPDLIIRPGGELRLSNFLLWQAGYAELYFSPVLWPDVDEVELDRALTAYSERHRRFGGL